MSAEFAFQLLKNDGLAEDFTDNVKSLVFGDSRRLFPVASTRLPLH